MPPPLSLRQLLFFFSAFVVDDGKRGFVDQADSLFLGDLHHLRERRFQEDARDLGQLRARFFGEFDVGIDAFRRIDDGRDVAFLRLDLFGEGLFEAGTPEIRAVAVAVIDGHGREVRRLYAVYDGIPVFFLHEDLIDVENKVCAELARNAVEGAVGRLVALQQPGLIEIGVFKRAVPGAFEHLKRLFHDQGTLAVALPPFQREQAVFHLFLRGVPGEAQPHRLAEILFVVGDEVERDFAPRQDVLRRV